jgi:uncharacterized protein YwlG (UPF0340 family)
MRRARKSRIIKLNRLSVNGRNNIFNCKHLKMLKVHPTRHMGGGGGACARMRTREAVHVRARGRARMGGMAVGMHKNYCVHAPNLKNRRKRAVAKNGVLHARNVPLQVCKRLADGFEACHMTLPTEKQ